MIVMDARTDTSYRSKLQHRLTLAERHVTESEARILKHRSVLTVLERSGTELKTVRETLKQFEELQKLHLDDLARLRRELASWDRATSVSRALE